MEAPATAKAGQCAEEIRENWTHCDQEKQWELWYCSVVKGAFGIVLFRLPSSLKLYRVV